MRESGQGVPGVRGRASDPLGRLNLATFLLSLTIYSPILVLFYTGRGLSLFQILALEAFNSAVILLAEVPAGVLGDRIGVKRTVFLGYGLQGVWILILISAHSYPVFLVGYAMLGVAIALLSVLIVRSATEGYFLLALAASAAAFFLAALLIATVRGVRESGRESQPASLELVGDGLRMLRDNPKLRRVALGTVVTDPMQYTLLFLYQPYFGAASTPLPLFGIAAAAGAGVGALAARSAHRFEAALGMRRAFWLAIVAPSLIYLLMAATRQPYLAVLLYVSDFGLMQLREPLAATMRNMHRQSYNRVTALSLISMGVSAWTFGGKLISGWPTRA